MYTNNYTINQIQPEMRGKYVYSDNHNNTLYLHTWVLINKTYIRVCLDMTKLQYYNKDTCTYMQRSATDRQLNFLSRIRGPCNNDRTTHQDFNVE